MHENFYRLFVILAFVKRDGAREQVRIGLSSVLFQSRTTLSNVILEKSMNIIEFGF